MVVEILLPEGTFERTKYVLLESVCLAGVTVPAGFITDGASSPRILWWLFPPTGRYFRAAAVHDYLLEIGTPWARANKIFYVALREQGLPLWVRISLFTAVSIYGRLKTIVTGERW